MPPLDDDDADSQCALGGDTDDQQPKRGTHRRATHKRIAAIGYVVISVCILLLPRLCGRMVCQDCVLGLCDRFR